MLSLGFGDFYVVPHLIFGTAFFDMCNYSHLINEEIEAQKFFKVNLSQIKAFLEKH